MPGCCFLSEFQNVPRQDRVFLCVSTNLLIWCRHVVFHVVFSSTLFLAEELRCANSKSQGQIGEGPIATKAITKVQTLAMQTMRRPVGHQAEHTGAPGNRNLAELARRMSPSGGSYGPCQRADFRPFHPALLKNQAADAGCFSAY